MAFNRNIYTNTEFLNINEINILESVKNKLPPVRINLTGGNNYAERKIAIFSPMEIYYQEEIPVSIIKIAPKNSKYADNLTHRDYLGAILNLGIVRSKIGDIFIKDNIAYIYCMSDTWKKSRDDYNRYLIEQREKTTQSGDVNEK